MERGIILLTPMTFLLAFLTSLPSFAQEVTEGQVAAFIEKLRSDSVEERDAAARKLKELGKSAAPELEKAAKDADAELASRAKLILKTVEIQGKLTVNLRRVLPGVEDRLAVGDDHASTEALLEAVQRARTPPGHRLQGADLEPLAAPALRGARTRDEMYRSILAALWYGPRSAAPELVRLIEDEKDPWRLRGLAVSALDKTDPEREPGFYVKLLVSGDTGVRSNAVGAIRRRKPEEAIPALAPFLESPRPEVRAAVAQALGNWAEKEARDLLAARLNDVHPRVRVAAVEAMEQGGPACARKIASMLSDPSPYIRGRVAWFLIRTEEKESLPGLTACLKDTHPYVRSLAVEAVDKFAGRDASDLLMPMLGDEHAGVRGAAALALCRRGVLVAAPVLIEGVGRGNIEFAWADPATDMTSSGHPPRPLFALNAFRLPELWKRLGETGIGTGETRLPADHFKTLSAQAGLAFDAPEQLLDSKSQQYLPAGLTLRQGLERLMGESFDIILEANRLRVVSRAQALEFWKAWWAEEEKKGK